MAATPPVEAAFAAEELGRLFAPLSPLARVGIAVSGGPDSTALMLLAHAWAERQPAPPHLSILTVDHALRPASAAEADAVLAQAERLGLAATKLIWQHDSLPRSDIQAQARDARYRLMAAAARDQGLDAVLLAHTRDDQAETVLMRLQRGSGVRGLAGMPERRVIAGVSFLRPLLDVPKARLTAYLEALGVPYVRDPSNQSDRFLRARVRQLMPALAALGLDASRLADTARRMARADQALAAATAELGQRAARDFGGVVCLDEAELAAAPDEIVLRLITSRLRAIRPRPVYPPRAEAPERWLAAWRRGEAPRRATMAGVVLDRRSSGLWLYAEAGRQGLPTVTIAGDGSCLWDDRCHVAVKGSTGRPVLIGPASGDARRPDLPKAAAASLPAFAMADGAPPPAGLEVAFVWQSGEPADEAP